jgi:hypothetical protein
MDPPVGSQLLLHRLGHTQVGVRALPVLLLVPGKRKRIFERPPLNSGKEREPLSGHLSSGKPDWEICGRIGGLCAFSVLLLVPGQTESIFRAAVIQAEVQLPNLQTRWRDPHISRTSSRTCTHIKPARLRRGYRYGCSVFVWKLEQRPKRCAFASHKLHVEPGM